MSRLLLRGVLILALAALEGGVLADQLYGIAGPKALPEGYFLGHLEDKVCLGNVGSVRCDWKVIQVEGG